MAGAGELKAGLEGAGALLAGLYGGGPGAVKAQAGRYAGLLDRFSEAFPGASDAGLFSAPGRTEVGGNHTDHNAGRVLAAAVDLDIIAAAAPAADGIIVIESEGYAPHTVSLDDLDPRESERFTAAAITRGVCARLAATGRRIGGFRACVTSTVPKGSGLSSSAAFEVLVATILNTLYNGGGIPALELAQAAQAAENTWFGKPCGLMDQTASAVGGFVAIDFADPTRPVVRKIDVDFAASGYAAVIVDTGASHADLNEDYAGIAREMKDVARALGAAVLRERSRQDVVANLPRLREAAGDRAVLRALHFSDENERALRQAEALQQGRFEEFLRLVVESGRSSWMLCQNCYPPDAVREQGIPVALALSETLLGQRGAWRVHGGGFAGTILAFVPRDLLAGYLREMQAVFGEGSCRSLSIRQQGAGRIDLA